MTTDSLHVAAEYERVNGLPFSLLPFPDRRHAALYRGFAVPQTVVVAGDGRVLFARSGVIDTLAALDSVLMVALSHPRPGARESSREGNDVTALTPASKAAPIRRRRSQEGADDDV